MPKHALGCMGACQPAAKVPRLTNYALLADSIANSESEDSERALRAELQKIIETKNPDELFCVDLETDDPFSAAAATRARLLKMSHPDRGRQHRQALWQLRNDASAHINELWKRWTSQSSDRGASPSARDSDGPRAHSGDVMAAYTMEQEDACSRRFNTGGQGSGSSIQMLELLRRTGKLACSEELRTYIGFGEYLTMSGCVFEPLGTNRAVNVDVVQKRVQKNLSSLLHRQRYCDFGTISLCAVRGDDIAPNNCAKFYILDGQHRIAVMQSLKEMRPNASIHFELRCKVVSSHREATEELFSMQDCHPPDPRCFFDSRQENEMASLLLDFAKIRWPQVRHPPPLCLLAVKQYSQSKYIYIYEGSRVSGGRRLKPSQILFAVIHSYRH